jgi:hypothetical protein
MSYQANPKNKPKCKISPSEFVSSLQTARELIIVDEHDAFLDNLKRRRFTLQKYLNEKQADRQCEQKLLDRDSEIRLERKKRKHRQRERELRRRLDQEEQQRLQREEYELKHYFRNVHIPDAFASGPRHCCRCHHESRILVLTCVECGHDRCLSCDAGPEYFFDATLRKYSYQLEEAIGYIQRANRMREVDGE